jgi:hypothetical protein
MTRFYTDILARKTWGRDSEDVVIIESQWRGAGIKDLPAQTLADLPLLVDWDPFAELSFHDIWRSNSKMQIKCREYGCDGCDTGDHYRPLAPAENLWLDGFRELAQRYGFWFARRYRGNPKLWYRRAQLIRPLHVSGKAFSSVLREGFQRDYRKWINRRETV